MTSPGERLVNRVCLTLHRKDLHNTELSVQSVSSCEAVKPTLELVDTRTGLSWFISMTGMRASCRQTVEYY